MTTQTQGSSGNDTLSSTTANTILRGGAGDDVYIVSHLNVMVQEARAPEGGELAGVKTITRVDEDIRGNPANADGTKAVWSPDGSLIAFISFANNLAPGDHGNQSDIFIKNVLTGQVRCISKSPDGEYEGIANNVFAFSPDGTSVFFGAESPFLVEGDTNAMGDVFRIDLGSGIISRISVSDTGAQANGRSSSPSISSDGSKLAFHSSATNLVNNDASRDSDVFVKDLITGSVYMASTNSQGVKANASAQDPVMLPDGIHVAFTSAATNLVEGDTNGYWDIFIKNVQTGEITLASTGSHGEQLNDHSSQPVFSADGTKMAFTTGASNLVPGDTNRSEDIFVKDLITGEVTRASTKTSGGQADSYSRNPSLSPDGRLLTFDSLSRTLTSDLQTRYINDVFVKDLVTGDIALISTSVSGGETSGGSYYPRFSPDGTRIVFQSLADNLLATDGPASSDIFVANIGIDEGGEDTVYAAVDYGLPDFVENLVLTGNVNLIGRGNSLANSLTGNTGRNLLDGMGGDDTMTGGLGSDSYYVDSNGDQIIEEPGGGWDKLVTQLGVNQALDINLEAVSLVGSANLNAYGNSRRNRLDGNDGNNRLDGMGGQDTLAGGLGDDTYVMRRGSSATIIETSGDNDLLQINDHLVDASRLWFRRVGDNLEISILGTATRTTIQDWYYSAGARVETIKAGDGRQLDTANVDTLVQAMAAFAGRPAGLARLTEEEHAALDTLIAANWT